MRRRNPLLLIALVTVLAGGLVLAGGCKKKPPKEAQATTPPAGTTEQATRPTPPPPPPPPPAPAKPSDSAADRPSLDTLNAQLKPVYFDFDQSNLRSDILATLDANAALINKYPDLKVRIEGHCDERGTVEYNLALGDRRATSALQGLVDRGVAKGRLSTISYGEEKPVDPGHSESAWWKNRRAEFRFAAP